MDPSAAASSTLNLGMTQKTSASSTFNASALVGSDFSSSQPQWLSLDRKVLRFFCYFRESVHESRIEQQRVRKCVIYFYLEDDTIQVSEPKQDNSGIPQGGLIKRHRIPKEGQAKGSYYGIDDLNIGNEVLLYGKKFRIVDCDSFTRVRENKKRIFLKKRKKERSILSAQSPRSLLALSLSLFPSPTSLNFSNKGFPRENRSGRPC